MRTRVSTKYQIVIPKEARRQEDIKPGQEMEVEVISHRIILSKAKSNKNWNPDYKKLGGLWKSSDDIDKYLEEQDRSWD